jgi:hypothetical protein
MYKIAASTDSMDPAADVELQWATTQTTCCEHQHEKTRQRALSKRSDTKANTGIGAIELHKHEQAQIKTHLNQLRQTQALHKSMKT